jgi:hypothetical protein
MRTVQDELARIHEDTDTLVALVESDTDVSRDLSEDLSRFSSDVQLALREHSRATEEYVGQLDYRLSDLRDRVASSIEATGRLFYKGQKEQAEEISGSVIGAGVIGGIFSLLGTAIAGKLVSNAIHDAAKSRPPTPDELKEKALLLLVAKIQDERSYVPATEIIDRATGANAILSAEDVRRILLLLVADGALESKLGEEGAPIRINQGHPKGQEVLGDRTTAKSEQPERRPLDFVDLGPEFGVSMSRMEVNAVTNIAILEINKEYIVRITYEPPGYHRVHDSRPCTTREEAERIRLLAQSRLGATANEA